MKAVLALGVLFILLGIAGFVLGALRPKVPIPGTMANTKVYRQEPKVPLPPALSALLLILGVGLAAAGAARK